MNYSATIINLFFFFIQQPNQVFINEPEKAKYGGGEKGGGKEIERDRIIFVNRKPDYFF